MMISLDGYFEGENHDLSWHNVDSAFNTFAIQQTQSVGVLLFGRKTYEIMRDYWPTDNARKEDPVVAHLMNTTPKIVVSSLPKTEEKIPYWEHVSYVTTDVKKEIEKLKQEAGKDIGVYGSNTLAVSLAEWGLLDEVCIMVNPVILGKGTPIFWGIKNRKECNLMTTKQFSSGNILLTYAFHT